MLTLLAAGVACGSGEPSRPNSPPLPTATVAPTAIVTSAPVALPTTAAPTRPPVGSTGSITASLTPRPEIAELEDEVRRRINAIRRDNGLESLEPVPSLAAVARAYSCQMARQDFFSHQAPGGERVDDRLREAGLSFRVVGENIALTTNASHPLPVVINGWMDSEGHRENILRESFTQTGVGICQTGTTLYFTQVFRRPA